MNTNSPVTQTQLSQFRTLAKQRSKLSGQPLHESLESIAQEHGFANWKQVLTERETAQASSASDADSPSHDRLSPGLALIGFGPYLLGTRGRDYFKTLISQGVADAKHNPLTGDVFIDVTIEKHRFQAGIVFGPHIRLHSVDGEEITGRCPLGVSTISCAERAVHLPDDVRQWYLCRYESEAVINLCNLSEAGRRWLSLEFGLPILSLSTGLLQHQAWYFYRSKAYAALVNWARNNPKKIVQCQVNHHLGFWAKTAALDAGLSFSKEEKMELADLKMRQSKYTFLCRPDRVE